MTMMHHAILASEDQDVFAFRDRAQAVGYDITEIGPRGLTTQESMLVVISAQVPMLLDRDVERRRIWRGFGSAYLATVRTSDAVAGHDRPFAGSTLRTETNEYVRIPYERAS